MIQVGFCGLGKLGLPVALAINSFGFDVCGTDINPKVKNYLTDRKIPYKEEFADDLLKTHKIIWHDTIDEVIRYSDVIFMPVQTPHDQRYEGITRLPPERKDFDYSYLIKAVQSFTNALALSSDPSPKTLVIISTVLPGTIRREIIPIIEKDKRIVLVYNPFFIAMGTTIHDFLNPEFVLLGVKEDDYYGVSTNLLSIYKKIHGQSYVDGENPFYRVMSIESAELTKVAYNTFITSKICIANTIGEICHKIPGANVDDVTNALKCATDRLISTKYLTAGLGDGGGCHPRDNIAMSWLAKKLGLSYDWFENLMISREKQAEFFVNLILEHKDPTDHVIILGYTFKPETNLTTGSHALLVNRILRENGVGAFLRDENVEEPITHASSTIMGKGKIIYFIGCKHAEFEEFKFPYGSVVVDPFRYIPDQHGVKVIRIGE